MYAVQLSADGRPLVGWEFTAFTLESRPGDEYQVAIARFTGRNGLTGHVATRGLVDGNGEGWLSEYDAGELIEQVSRE